MSVNLQELLDFNLTGRREGTARSDAGSYPALLAPYRDLEALRYDFPLVLLDSAETEAVVDTLTAVINRLLREIAADEAAGTLLRQHVLRLERRMRELAADSPDIKLTALWQQAEQTLLRECPEAERDLLGSNLATARFALRVDGVLADCDERLPARILGLAWQKREARRRRVSAAKIETLVIRLRGILKADDLKKSSSRTPTELRKSFGQSYREAFDFELMSEILEGTALRNPLPIARRHRIAAALAVLEEQRFFPLFGTERKRHHYGFVFKSLSAALGSYNDRLQAAADVIKAMEIAELEIDNAYREDRHSNYFNRHGPQALTAEDLALFPFYLVCLHEDRCTSRDTARLMEIVSCELPIKVLLQVSAPLGEPSPVDGSPHQGAYVQQLVHTFVAGNAFIHQSTASNLYRASASLSSGLAFEGPAIFSVYAPQSHPAALPAYLESAAAMESRVFPTFSYDPSAGAGLASRFDITGNPDVEADWPKQELRYEDEALQAVVEDYRFTLADFAVLDPRYGEHFAAVGQADWTDAMVPVADYLDLPGAESVDHVPYVVVTDAENRLRRWIVDENLVRLVRRCRDRWRSLQELGGVHNSYAAAAREERAAEEPLTEQAPVPAETAAAPPGEQAASAELMEPVADAEVTNEGTDEPWIETPRCTTCDECTTRNPRMFAYDDNKQAYIADPDAGTFRDLVEAAETCQVAIIHPGKPRNPDEPGLEELVRRAEPFNVSA